MLLNILPWQKKRLPILCGSSFFKKTFMNPGLLDELASSPPNIVVVRIAGEGGRDGQWLGGRLGGCGRMGERADG